jgi:hypothetical protein
VCSALHVLAFHWSSKMEEVRGKAHCTLTSLKVHATAHVSTVVRWMGDSKHMR